MKNQILKPKQVAEITGKSLSTLWRDEKAGTFPKRLRIGRHATGWRASDIEEWMDGLPSAK